MASLDRATLQQFVPARRAGTLTVPDVKLSAKPTDRTIGADLEFLRRVCNWALAVTRGNGKPLLTAHPLTRYAIPRNANPRRPIATYERYLAIREHADPVDRQRLFGPFLDLVEGLGWRVSALCSPWASDVDLGDCRSPLRAHSEAGGVGQDGCRAMSPDGSRRPGGRARRAGAKPGHRGYGALSGAEGQGRVDPAPCQGPPRAGGSGGARGGGQAGRSRGRGSTGPARRQRLPRLPPGLGDGEEAPPP